MRLVAEKLKTDDTVTLKLVQDGVDVHIKAIDSLGKEWFIVTFLGDGKLQLSSCIPVELGFKLDDERRIVVVKT